MRQLAEHAVVQEAGCGAVWFLAYNADNKAKIVADGGLQLALEAIQKHAGHAGVKMWGSLAAERLRE
eukprot:530986-Rhodomonas_salina.1